eukprot:TRINITY_DN50409_c0_g1_i1.p1 TRINITY_DN50409_c0_g1~~TRINITY_DN50409_c0_g1_i1.p1  ORF type:complete len:766 (+),score=149.52 TRINITY_DN50409_c0_g1_i1:86-2299(+)
MSTNPYETALRESNSSQLTVISCPTQATQETIPDGGAVEKVSSQEVLARESTSIEKHLRNLMPQEGGRIVNRLAFDAVINLDPPAEVWDESPARLRVGRIVGAKPFKLAISFCIIVSMVLAVYETDKNAINEPTGDWFGIVMIILTMIYMVEIILRVYVYGPHFFTDVMNVFEASVVVVDVFFAVFENITGEAPQLFILRVCRLVRVLRIVRLMRLLRPLFLILHGFFAAMQAIIWATILLLVMIGLWSILAVDALHPVNATIPRDHCDRCERAFISVAASSLTFMESVLAGETWNELSIPVIEKEPWTMFIFLGVHITVNMGIMNLILAVIVDQAAQGREADAEQLLLEKQRSFTQAKAQLYSLCEQMDTDSSGTLTGAELTYGIEHVPEFAAMLRLMDVCLEDMEIIFKILDSDNSGDIDYQEFTEQLFKMKSQDSHSLLVFIKFYVLEVRDRLEGHIDVFRNFVTAEDEEMKQMLKELIISVQELTRSRRNSYMSDIHAPATIARHAMVGDVLQTVAKNIQHFSDVENDQIAATNHYNRFAEAQAASTPLSPPLHPIKHEKWLEWTPLLSSLEIMEKEAKRAMDRVRERMDNERISARLNLASQQLERIASENADTFSTAPFHPGRAGVCDEDDAGNAAHSTNGVLKSPSKSAAAGRLNGTPRRTSDSRSDGFRCETPRHSGVSGILTPQRGARTPDGPRPPASEGMSTGGEPQGELVRPGRPRPSSSDIPTVL